MDTEKMSKQQIEDYEELFNSDEKLFQLVVRMFYEYVDYYEKTEPTEEELNDMYELCKNIIKVDPDYSYLWDDFCQMKGYLPPGVRV